jgi:hypothetical protein
LLYDSQRGLLLLVGRAAVLAEDAADGAAQVGADAFLDGPVVGHVAVQGYDQVAGDGAQGVVAEDLDGAVVDAQGVVEGELVFAEAQVFAALAGGAPCRASSISSAMTWAGPMTGGTSPH